MKIALEDIPPELLPNCGTLKKHMVKLFQLIEYAEDTDDISSGMEENFSKIQNLKSLGIYQEAFKETLIEYKIPQIYLRDTMLFLEQIAIKYIGAFQPIIIQELANAAIAKTEVITKLAQRLEKEISSLDEHFHVNLLVLGYDEVEQKATLPSKNDFGKIKECLSTISNLKKDVEQTPIGQVLKIGQPSKKENYQLHFWVEGMILFWTQGLKRSFKYDREGINGRTVFINFMIKCFKEIHELEDPDQLVYVFNNLRKKGIGKTA